MWRFLPLALILSPFLLRSDGRDSLPPPAIRRQITIGLLSQSGYLLTVYWAIGLGVSTGTTALIDGLQPLVVAALVGPILGIAVSSHQWIGLTLGFVGVGVVTWADATSPATHAPLWSYAIPLIGMFCLVGATLLERRSTHPIAPLRSLAIHCTTSAVVFSILAIATGTALPPSTSGFWLSLSWLIAFSTFGGYGLYWYLMRRIGITQVNTLMFLVPPITAAWGATMFGEPFTIATGLGLALGLTATLMVIGHPLTAHRPAATETDRAHHISDHVDET